MSLTAFIFARGGSKGLPNKNIKILQGKPLIAWSIEQALAVNKINRVVVSTDSRKIADIAITHGAEVPFIRPPELSSDNAPEMLAWRHALLELKAAEGEYPEIFLSTPSTSPLRASEDIEKCINLYLDNESSTDVVVAVTDAHRNPYFNMVRINDDGFTDIVIKPESNITRRQDTDILYDLTTVAYVVRASFIFSFDSLFKGRVRSVKVPLERSIDIDTQFDFDIAEFLMSKKQGADKYK